MIRAHADNALLAATYDGLGKLAKVCACFIGGALIGAGWYLLVGLRAGGM